MWVYFALTLLLLVPLSLLLPKRGLWFLPAAVFAGIGFYWWAFGAAWEDTWLWPFDATITGDEVLLIVPFALCAVCAAMGMRGKA
jgi:hypothetical protein